MADHDLVLRNGTMVDGSGGASFSGDVAISGGRIRAMSTVPGNGREESFPTFFLTYWVRDRAKGSGPRFSLPDAVNPLTRRNALAVGLPDRGLIGVGMKADINIIDYDALHLGAREEAFDLPAGGRRVFQRATGLDATMVNGEVTYRGGVSTGVLSERLIRVNVIKAPVNA